MKCCSGRRAGLCGRRALGARVKGWLSEALVQKWTETRYIKLTVTSLLNQTHIQTIFFLKQFITHQESENNKMFHIYFTVLPTHLFIPTMLLSLWLLDLLTFSERNDQTKKTYQLSRYNRLYMYILSIQVQGYDLLPKYAHLTSCVIMCHLHGN